MTVSSAFFWPFPLTVSAKVDHAFGRIWATIEEQVLDMFEQVLGNFLVDPELPGVDNPHVHPGPDSMVEKRRVHRLTYQVVAAEGEGDIAHTAADLGSGQVCLIIGWLEVIDGVSDYAPPYRWRWSGRSDRR